MRNTTSLEEAIRDSGEGWLIDMFAPPEQAITSLLDTLSKVGSISQTKLGGNSPSFTQEYIVREYNLHPLQVRAFFQCMGGTQSPEMLLMAWRIIQGMEIKKIDLSYTKQNSFSVTVILESPYGEQDALYRSSRIQDFALFRHIGIIESSGPIFDGFYPLKVRG